MTLALAATDNGDGTVDLAVTGAAHASSPVYTSDFSAGVNSWAGGSLGGTPIAPSTGTAPDGSGTPCLTLTVPPGGGGAIDPWVQRAMSGLTVGHTYRFTATAQILPAYGYPSEPAELTGPAPADPNVYFTLSKGAPVTVSMDLLADATTETFVVHPMGGSGLGHNIAVWDVTVAEITAGLEPLQIQRTDANGARYVRFPRGAAPDVTGALAVVDAEPATSGLVTYVVRDGIGATDSDTVTLDYPTPLVHTVGYTTTLDVARVDGYEGGRRYQVQADVLPIIGRQDPLTTDRGDATWSLRQGSLTFAPAASYADADAVVEVYTAGRVVMLRQATHPGLDLYHVATEIQGPTPVYLTDAGWRWQVTVRYVEVGWPAGDLYGSASWTYNDLELHTLAYWNLPDEFPTYADLKAGP